MNEKIPSHITDLEWSRFWQNQMTAEEQDALLAHTCDCLYCSGRMAEVPSEQTLTAPAYLKEETLCHIRTLEQQERFRSPFRNNRLRLFTYSLKVSLAAACALVVLFTVPLPNDYQPDNLTDKFFSPSGNESSASKLPENEWFETKQFGTGRSFTGFLNEGTSFINNKLNEFSTQFLNKEDIPYEKQK